MSERRRRRSAPGGSAAQSLPTNSAAIAKVISMEGVEYVPKAAAEKEVSDVRTASKQILSTLSSSVISRSELFQFLGKSFGGGRDLYKVLGYPRTLRYSNYEERYGRQEIAKAVIDRPVNSSWRKKPLIVDDDTPDIETDFEKAWAAVQKKAKIYNYMTRADKLAGLGQYSVLLMGFNDGNKLDIPVESAEGLSYIQVFSEDNAEIEKWDEDQNSERYGRPVFYKLKVFIKDGATHRSIRVHYSRIIHIPGEVLESDIYGIPQLRAVFNRLQDLETLSGGSAEMYWKGARPGYALEIDPDYTFDENDKADLTDELQEFDHELRRVLRLKGMKMKGLEPQVKDPDLFIAPILDLIAAGVNIPKRILMGSERGELASGQDKVVWNERMETRRDDYVEPWIIRPVVDKLIEVGVIPAPMGDEYEVKWPEFDEPGEEAITQNAKRAAEAIATYANSPGSDLVLPIEEFLQRWLRYSKAQVEKIMAIKEGLLADEDLLAAEIAKITGKGDEKPPDPPNQNHELGGA